MKLLRRSSVRAKKMTLKEAITRLFECGIDSADHDARVLFREFAGACDLDLINRAFSSDSEALADAVSRRCEREPLQYILGYTDFYKEHYTVTPDCLIPRPDTEILVDYAVRHLPRGAVFADLCCGSGCVGISTLKNTDSTTAILADISDAALDIARKNAADNGVADRAEIIKLDVLGECVGKELFAVLSNPPYVTDSAYAALEPEIYCEPKIAFVGGEDGGDFYRALTPMYKSRIAQGGFIAYEIGYDQAQLLSDIADEHGMTCEIIYDFSKNPRVAVLRNP